jgi:hypothetical protein
MPLLTTKTHKPFAPQPKGSVAFEMDVENARVSSTPDALTVIDPRVSTMGLRGVADGSLVL